MLTLHEQSGETPRADGRDRPQRARRRPAAGHRHRRAQECRARRHGRRDHRARAGRSSPPTRIDLAQWRGVRLSRVLHRPADARRRRASAPWPTASARSPSCSDPVGDVIAEWDRPNGLHIERVRTPLGVIGVIYESRPNVTADAGALCLKAGNAGDPARRLGFAEFVRRHPCLPGRGPEGRRPAGGCDPAGADHRPRRRRRDADGPRRQSRRHRAARRQEPRRPRAERGARAGLRASRRHLPSSISTARPSSTWR